MGRRPLPDAHPLRRDARLQDRAARRSATGTTRSRSRARAPTRSSSGRAGPTGSNACRRRSPRAGSTRRRPRWPCCPRPRTSTSRSIRATCRSTSTARPAPAASRSTRPTPPCGSPTGRRASSSRCRTRRASCRTARRPCACCARGFRARAGPSSRPSSPPTRSAQVGTGERAEKIRTYNFPERRVTDHRVKVTVHNLDGVLQGELEELTGALQDDEKRRPPRRAGRGLAWLLGAAGDRTGSTPSCCSRTSSASIARRSTASPSGRSTPSRPRPSRGSSRAGRPVSRWPTSSGAAAFGGSSWPSTRGS